LGREGGDEGVNLDERGAIYQMSFSANCIWRDVVAVDRPSSYQTVIFSHAERRFKDAVESMSAEG
jgi:hypothetical protein